jgi:hypothetical protein
MHQDFQNHQTLIQFHQQKTAIKRGSGRTQILPAYVLKVGVPTLKTHPNSATTNSGHIMLR